ncbi:hypothetical protein [Qipengyuania sp. RANM35]|uniref:hypothetical protein n=1 Tax=Qipengyuania sp. RANM35 TaxID=3068635 RepID=UPI0034DAE44E
MSRLDRLFDEIQRMVDAARPAAERKSAIAAKIAAAARAGGKTSRKRKPPESGIAIPAVPPKGPLPMQGGAEAPLTFD